MHAYLEKPRLDRRCEVLLQLVDTRSDLPGTPTLKEVGTVQVTDGQHHSRSLIFPCHGAGVIQEPVHSCNVREREFLGQQQELEERRLPTFPEACAFVPKIRADEPGPCRFQRNHLSPRAWKLRGELQLQCAIQSVLDTVEVVQLWQTLPDRSHVHVNVAT